MKVGQHLGTALDGLASNDHGCVGEDDLLSHLGHSVPFDTVRFGDGGGDDLVRISASVRSLLFI